MNLISDICWLLILHLPVYSPASNHAETSFRFGPDYEYKNGILSKRKDNGINHLRAYYTYPPIWKPKNTHNFLYYSSGHLFITTRQRPRLPKFPSISNHKFVKDLLFTRTPKHKEKYNSYEYVTMTTSIRITGPYSPIHPKTPTTTRIETKTTRARPPKIKNNKKEKKRLEKEKQKKIKEKKRLEKERREKIKEKERLEKERRNKELMDEFYYESLWEREHRERFPEVLE